MEITLSVKEQSLEEGAIDEAEGTIRGVSLISTPEAKGHNMSIDEKSIESFYEAVEGKSIKAYYTHSDSNDALDSIGLWKNFTIKQDGEYTKLLADFVALKAWKENNKKDYEMLFELAKEAPEAFGVSAEFTSRTIVYGEDGEEKEYEEGEDDDMERFARAVEVSAFSIVAQPAANPTGLFSAPVKDLTIKLATMGEKNSKMEMDLSATQKTLSLLQEKQAELQVELDAKEKEIQTWKARYGEAIAGAEPVIASHEEELSFSDKLARCNTNQEKQTLIQNNMKFLSENWNQLK